MSSPPLPDLDAVAVDGLKRLVVQLLARVAALEEENRRLREENARLKKLPKRPRLAPGGMDRAAGARRRRRSGRGWRRAAWTGRPGRAGGAGPAAAAGARRRPPRSASSRWRRRRAPDARATSPTPSRTWCSRRGSSATGGSGG